jgi:16S rRNA (guanine527-N7)-methyltransferase
VSDSSFEEFIFRHVLDSLSVTRFIEIDKMRNIIDIGSGAGFPGIPIKIVYPSLELISVESIRKKAVFQSELINHLHLERVTVAPNRAETLERTEIRESLDFAVSRAVASISTLAEITLPFLKIGGIAVFYKSVEISDELSSAKKAITACGGKLLTTHNYRIRESDSIRSLVVLQKTDKTPLEFPRREGIPFKKPIS